MSKYNAKSKIKKMKGVDLATVVQIYLLIAVPLTIFPASASSSEPSLETILNH